MILEYSEKGIVFFPDPYLVGTPADFGLEYEDVYFEAADGVKLHGWWVPRPGPRSWCGSTATPATSATAWKISNCSMTWRGSRSSSSTTGSTADPRAASAGRAPFWTRPRPTVTWPKPEKSGPGHRPLRPLPGHRPGHGPGRTDTLPRPDPRVGLHQLLGHGPALPPFCSTGGPGCPMTTWGKLIKSGCRCSSSTAKTTKSSRWTWAAASLPRPTPPRNSTSSPGPSQRHLPGGGKAYFDRLNAFIFPETK